MNSKTILNYFLTEEYGIDTFNRVILLCLMQVSSLYSSLIALITTYCLKLDQLRIWLNNSQDILLKNHK